MPTVPRYRRQVRAEPLPDTRQGPGPSPDVYGAQVGQAIAGLGETIARAGAYGLSTLNRRDDERQNLEDRVATQRAGNQLLSWVNTRLRDPDGGALNVRGLEARDQLPLVEKEYKDVSSKIAGELRGERQRLAFEAETANRWESVSSELSRHISSEFTKYQAAEAVNGLDLRVTSAGGHFMDFAAVGQDQAQGIAIIKDQKLGPEATKAEIEKFNTRLHSVVIDQFLAHDQDRTAQIYYEENEQEISSVKRPQIVKALREGNVRGEAQRQSDAIIADGGTLLEQRDKAKAIEDPEVRDRVLGYLEEEVRIRKRETQVDEEDLMVTAGNLIDKGGLKAVPPSLWVQLTPAQKNSLEQYAKRHVTGGDPEGKTDLGTFYKLEEQAVLSPEKFAELNLMESRHKLSRTDFKRFVTLQMKIRKGDTTGRDEQIESFTTKAQVYADILEEFKLEKDDPRAVQLRREIDKRYETSQEIGGKKLTHTEVRDIADDILGTVVLQKGGWLNFLPGGAPFSDVTAAMADLTVAGIPPVDRRMVEKQLRDAGQPVTDALILDWYKRAARKAGRVR